MKMNNIVLMFGTYQTLGVTSLPALVDLNGNPKAAINNTIV